MRLGRVRIKWRPQGLRIAVDLWDLGAEHGGGWFSPRWEMRWPSCRQALRDGMLVLGLSLLTLGALLLYLVVCKWLIDWLSGGLVAEEHALSAALCALSVVVLCAAVGRCVASLRGEYRTMLAQLAAANAAHHAARRPSAARDAFS